MISKKLAIDVLNEALATGADYAEIFYEDSDARGISIENGKVDCKLISFWKVAEGLGMKPSELLSIIEKELGDDFKLIDE